jgi:carboxyl-terminal processing protease
MVVLVNRGTASAAEIVTGALKDRGRATVVGTNTYGKGVFQEIQQVPGGGALDITVGEYFTPNGHNLGAPGVAEGKSVDEGRGIEPDVYVAETCPARLHRSVSQCPVDSQLSAAERIVAAKIR